MSQKADSIRLFSWNNRPMRVFHISWMAFFRCFCAFVVRFSPQAEAEYQQDLLLRKGFIPGDLGEPEARVVET